MEDYLIDYLDRYEDNIIGLDAILQWANNPTSMSAKYALEENNEFIRNNLTVRYADQIDLVNTIINDLNQLNSRTVKDKYTISKLQEEINQIFRFKGYINTVADHVSERLLTSSLESKLFAYFTSEYNIFLEFAKYGNVKQTMKTRLEGDNFDYLVFLIELVTGRDVDGEHLIDELIFTGFLNILYYRSTGDNEKIEYYFLKEAYVDISLFEDKTVSSYENDIHSYIQQLFDDNAIEQLIELNDLFYEDRTRNYWGEAPFTRNIPKHIQFTKLKQIIQSKNIGQKLVLAVNPFLSHIINENVANLKYNSIEKFRGQIERVINILVTNNEIEKPRIMRYDFSDVLLYNIDEDSKRLVILSPFFSSADILDLMDKYGSSHHLIFVSYDQTRIMYGSLLENIDMDDYEVTFITKHRKGLEIWEQSNVSEGKFIEFLVDNFEESKSEISITDSIETPKPRKLGDIIELVIDGPNLARSRNKGKIDFETFPVILNQLKQEFNIKNVIIWISAAFVYQLNNEQPEFNSECKRLINEGIIVVAPGKTSDDDFLLSHAYPNKIAVISNDQYRSEILRKQEYQSWLDKKRIPFSYSRREKKFIFDNRGKDILKKVPNKSETK